MVVNAVTSPSDSRGSTNRGASANCTAPLRRGDGRELSLLLVSGDTGWTGAVTSAAQQIGIGNVATCGAKEALARLAGLTPRYSHLLIEENKADGLLKELADLANEIADPATDMLMLGTVKAGWPHIRIIPAADANAVHEALMTTQPRNRLEYGIEPGDLQAALDSAMIETRYQPIIRMADRHPVGLEALARLNHPVAGILLPDKFVPQMENAGLAAQLTELVTGRVMNDLQTAHLANAGLRISINFPLDVMLLPAALDRLEEQRAAGGIPAGQIIIELTESRPVADVVTLRRSLEFLRRLGYGAAIDDVGPAVPRLTPLLDLPFTSLKLDKDQVSQVIASAEIRAFLTKTIIQAKQHGLTVVAEGVETEAIWTAILDLGADEAQGFLASRPLPVAAVPIWLDAWNKPPANATP